MTLYEQTGFCPLYLRLNYFEKRECADCPMNDGVDIGVGWLTHCNNECRLQQFHDNPELLEEGK